jgi:hypothetical protein
MAESSDRAGTPGEAPPLPRSGTGTATGTGAGTEGGILAIEVP